MLTEHHSTDIHAQQEKLRDTGSKTIFSKAENVALVYELNEQVAPAKQIPVVDTKHGPKPRVATDVSSQPTQSADRGDTAKSLPRTIKGSRDPSAQIGIVVRGSQEQLDHK